MMFEVPNIFGGFATQGSVSSEPKFARIQHCHNGFIVLMITVARRCW